jgi:hypothetical protein
MPEPTLPALLSLVGAYLLDREDEKPAWPATGPAGLDDTQLWNLIQTNGDVLAGMSFEEALAQDPRRIDALVQQRVTNEFFRALARAPEGNLEQLLRHAYVLRNDALRQDGRISAEALAISMEQTWEHYGKILDVAWAMRQPEAVRVREAILANGGEIRRAFREAADITRRAANVAPETDRAAWARMFATLHAMWESVETKVAQAGIALPAEGFGVWKDENVDWWQAWQQAGRRGEREHATADYRRSGGRL